MTDNQRPSHRGVMRFLTCMALLFSGALLQGCQNGANGPAGSKLRVFAADLSGAAKSCDVPKITPAAGQDAEAAIKVGNDGGWCALVLHQPGPQPYEAGLLLTRPAHGTVLVHEVGDETRIDYTPDRSYTGTDSFSVKLIPGDATIHAAVTVTKPQA